MKIWPNQGAAANPAIALRLQSMRPAGRVAELGSLGVIHHSRSQQENKNETMKITLVILAAALAFVAGATSTTAAGADGAAKEAAATGTPPMIFSNYQDLKWNKMHPDLGENSPEVCILRIDPKRQATSLLIRAPKGIHVRKHWHSANETHTVILGTFVFACEGKRIEQGPGSFNYMPAKMVHEAWISAGSLVFITVDGAWDINWVEGPPTAADLTK